MNTEKWDELMPKSSDNRSELERKLYGAVVLLRGRDKFYQRWKGFFDAIDDLINDKIYESRNED